MLTRFSLAKIGITVGGILTVIGLLAYFVGDPNSNLNSTVNLGAFFYGLPLFLGGLAFKITELKPAQYIKPTPPEVLELRKKEATATQKQVRKDVTRYRYGQDIHLDVALARLGLTTREEDLPVLTGLYEEARHDHYALVLEFDSPAIPFEKWESQQPKIQTFFGPGILAEVEDLGEDRTRLALVSTPNAKAETEENAANSEATV